MLNMAVTGLVGYGSVDVLRKIRRGEDFTIRDFFPTDELGSVMALTFVKDIYLFLWSLLFVIPGIIKGYSYSQVYYIANENPGMSVDDIITESREMMDGHKWELFILQVSFIGWGRTLHFATILNVSLSIPRVCQKGLSSIKHS